MVPPRDGRVVFDIGGNTFRLVAWINFHYGVVDVRFIGTHRAYDAFDAQAI
jgi:mRNA interferase HigB